MGTAEGPMGRRERRQHSRKLAGNSGLLLKGQHALHHFQGGLLSCRDEVQDHGDSDSSSHSPARMGQPLCQPHGRALVAVLAQPLLGPLQSVVLQRAGEPLRGRHSCGYPHFHLDLVVS